MAPCLPGTGLTDGADLLQIGSLPTTAQQRLLQKWEDYGGEDDGRWLLQTGKDNRLRAGPPWAGEITNVAANSGAGGGRLGHLVQDSPDSSSPAHTVIWKVALDRDIQSVCITCTGTGACAETQGVCTTHARAQRCADTHTAFT